MGVPRHRHLFRKQVARIAPDLRTDELHGAIRYYDCQVDDARLVVTVARTAALHGAHVATRTRVTGFLREGERVVGVRARDLETGRELEVRARVVVNAAGVWTDEIQEMVGGRGSLDVQASKGIHLVVPRDRIRSEAGFITRTETSVLFVIPWGRHWIIGTTDTAWDLDKAHPAASKADIDYVLDHVNAILREPLDHDDVEGVYAGLRPLLSGESRADRPDLPRAHRGDPGARPGDDRRRQAHDVPRDGEGRGRRRRPLAADHRQPTVRPSITDRVPLVGAEGFEARSNQRVALARAPGCTWPASTTCSAGTAAWSTSCSSCSPAVPTWRSRCPATEDYLAAEVVYAVTHEGARHLDDVLTRRTRISIETFDRGIPRPGRRAELMAGELGWDEARTDDEVDHYLRRVEAERQSQEQLTDQEADEARVSAPDIV